MFTSKTNVLFKKSFRFLQFLFLFLILFSLVQSAEKKYTEESMKAKLVLGMGTGTFAVIVAIAVGVVVCVLGLAFATPGLFVFIGIVIPCIVFIFVIFCPRIEEKEVMDWENTKRNSYIVARWFHFLIMLILFLGLVAPYIMYLAIVVIPQRVDSRAQIDNNAHYFEQIEKQKKKKYHLEESESEGEPLIMNNQRKLKRKVNESGNEPSKEGNLIGESVENSGMGGGINNLPPSMQPRGTLKDDLHKNREKFNKLKRKPKGAASQ